MDTSTNYTPPSLVGLFKIWLHEKLQTKKKKKLHRAQLARNRLAIITRIQGHAPHTTAVPQKSNFSFWYRICSWWGKPTFCKAETYHVYYIDFCLLTKQQARLGTTKVTNKIKFLSMKLRLPSLVHQTKTKTLSHHLLSSTKVEKCCLNNAWYINRTFLPTSTTLSSLSSWKPGDLTKWQLQGQTWFTWAWM